MTESGALVEVPGGWVRPPSQARTVVSNTAAGLEFDRLRRLHDEQVAIMAEITQVTNHPETADATRARLYRVAYLELMAQYRNHLTEQSALALEWAADVVEATDRREGVALAIYEVRPEMGVLNGVPVPLPWNVVPGWVYDQRREEAVAAHDFQIGELAKELRQRAERIRQDEM